MASMAQAQGLLQSSCDSNGQPRPAALLERFIDADCADCWRDAATPQAGRGQLAIDWIVPSDKGDDASLSAAQSADAALRLRQLGRAAPPRSTSVDSRVGPQAALPLRVARGPVFNGYVGASIEVGPLTKASRGAGPLSAWLLVIERVPAGTAGSPIARNLVRNSFETALGAANAVGRGARRRYSELRPMQLPEGSDPERLQAIGWVQDARGHILAAAASHCGVGD
ncbi:MAG: hypothetical protein JSR49_03920 [Proteobacteria bacterium]|nr:hypothetical protein [Pseudomonadota bacterium]